MKKNIIRTITKNAIVAAIYFLLTLISFPISYGMLQVRVAEMLCLLCFFNKDYIYGVSVGCLLANMFGILYLGSAFGAVDVIVGTIATILSCVGISLVKNLFVSTLIPVVINGFAIGAECFFMLETKLNFFIYVGFVALGEFIAVSCVGYIVFSLLRKNKFFLKVINANRK